MRKIILIGGVLASGKSTYSKFLSKKYNLSLINKDSLKNNPHKYDNIDIPKISITSFDYLDHE